LILFCFSTFLFAVFGTLPFGLDDCSRNVASTFVVTTLYGCFGYTDLAGLLSAVISSNILYSGDRFKTARPSID
uniref:Ion_trans_2 domain-containing protein n=1 Tax=Brugia timori TaxID=42155 RepID=A0A0R3QDJ5_9BILA